MKVATLRSFMALHSWVGIATGLLLFIAFYAGALTVCHESLDGWERTGPPSPTAVEPARAQALVDAFRAAHPATNADFRLTLSGEGNGQPRIDWRGAGSVPHAVELRPGGALDDIADTVGFAEMVHRLHYSAGIPLPWGAYLFGVVCVLYGLALVSGVVVHLPVLRRDLFALRPGRNRKRFWQDAHNLGGLFALPFHIVFAWTGAVLTIGTLMLAPFQVFVFEGRLLNLIGAEVGLAPPVAAAGVAAPMVDVARALAIAGRQVPGLTPAALHYENAGDARALITVEGAVDRQRMSRRASVTIDAVRGDVRRVVEPSQSSTGQTFLHTLYALHFGDYGGAAVRWLYVLLGLTGAAVFFTGNLLWIEARRRHRTTEQRAVCIRMAQLTLGVCLGCIGGIASMALAVRVGPALRMAVDVQAVYWATFVAALGCAFACRPARGAVALLWAAAALHAAIPLADWLTEPAGRAAHLAPDLASIAFALGFAATAHVARHRASSGSPNSVWAAPAAALPASAALPAHL